VFAPFPHYLRRPFRGLVAAFFLGVLLVPGAAVAQAPERDGKIAELEEKLAGLKKQLAALKGEQPAGKRPLQVADLQAWKAVRGNALSDDGEWFACRIGPGEGDGEVVLRQTRGDKEYKFPAGGPTFGQLEFSRDCRWFAFTIAPPFSRSGGSDAGASPSARRAPRGKVGLVNLATGEKTEFDGVRRFAFSGEAGTWIVLHKYPPEPPTGGTAAGATPPTPPAPPSPFARPGGAGDRPSGADLVLHELATKLELTLGNVSEFAFDKRGDWLALAVATQDQAGNGVQLRNMKTAALLPLDAGKAVYQGLTWTEKGDGLAVLKGVEDAGYEDKLFSVLGFTKFTDGTPEKTVFDPRGDSSFPRDMTASPSRAPSWTEDLGGILFGIHQPRKKDTKPAGPPGTKSDAEAAPKAGNPEAKAADGGRAAPAPRAPEKPDLVIWHWADDRLQSEQQVQANADRAYSYLCVYRVGDKKFHRLADDTLRQVSVAPHQRWAVGLDGRPYQRAGSLDGQRYQDVYVIDLQTGARRPALSRNRWYFGPSPTGTHFLYYEDGQFCAYDMAAGSGQPITLSAGVSFVNTEDDHNVAKPPTRPFGFTKDGESVLLSDNWDVWQVPVRGGPATNLTADGRKDGVRYRARYALDPEERGIDLSRPQYFAALGERTKKAGFARLDPGKPGVTRLLWDDALFTVLTKARNAEVFVYTRETAKDFPDYYAADATFANGRRLTTANPQQDQFAWGGGSLLLDYTSAKGEKLQAALYLPANYDKGKRYPTIVYIYERLSQELNRYASPTTGGFNKSFYTSNGYAVLMPDIAYHVNDPGMSAVWCVLPALYAAVNSGVVDRTRVGLHGHSWGGYQTAFLITQTDAFKAAAAGAALTDLISMYSLIYWNSGWTNQPIFESSQGRFTGGYWDNLDAYVRNSPVFHAKNVKTPLLLLHNDKDGAVDWTQGIEYFNTLRRLDKPVVMLQYKGENHGLAKPANRKDYTVRMREFFDHHLTDKPAPAWLKEGVPHLKHDEHLKERDK
jgi:dipeptidyl aminopeptidase/acylaminoacyl peptidase